MTERDDDLPLEDLDDIADLWMDAVLRETVDDPRSSALAREEHHAHSH